MKPRFRIFSWLLTISGLLLFLAIPAQPDAEDVPAGVKTLFAENCAGCHKGKFPPEGLSWEPDDILKSLDAPSRQVPSLKIIDTSAPENSYVLKKLLDKGGFAGRPMPPGKRLTEADLETLEAWLRGLKKGPGRPAISGGNSRSR